MSVSADHLAALDLAAAEFGRRLAAVGPSQWSRPTPCDEWDVRYLVAHVVGGNRFAALVLDGMAASAAFEAIMAAPQLGERPAEDFAGSAREQRRRFAGPGALERDVDHPVGTISGRRFLAFRVWDLTLHAWDLAVALDADRTLDAGLVEAVIEIVRAEPAITAAAGGAGGDAPGVDAQQRLLVLAGRA